VELVWNAFPSSFVIRSEQLHLLLRTRFE